MPWPQLTFEYVPGGSLDTCIDLSTLENVQALRQLLSALQYLHGQNPPIGHRDIKPDNILVLYRRSSGIYVKFADFGLAKAADYLKTFCGTIKWAAPEIYHKIPDPKATADDRYSVAVDIWSLGVVIASQECGLPYYEDWYYTSDVAWIQAVLQHVENYEEKGNRLLYFLLNTMLVVNPQERKGAPYCHDKALRLSYCDSRIPFLHRIADESYKDSNRGTPTMPETKPSMGHGEASEESTIRPSPRADGLRTQAESTAEGTSMPNAQLRQGPKNSVVLTHGSVLDSVLLNPEPASVSSSHDAAGTKDDARPDELSLSFLIRYHLDGRAQDNETQEVPGVAAGKSRQPGSKRTWPGDRSPLASAHQSVTDPTPGVADLQHEDIVGRDDSSIRVPRSGKRRKNFAKTQS